MLQNERYNRQVMLNGFGREAQQKLADAKVLVIGAGGLGCPALQYLAAAGAGAIGIADADVVSLSNLQRQVLYTTPDIGDSKVIVAAQRLRQMNTEISICEHPVFVDNQNALALFANYDYILDCTDNFAARYLINDACVLLGKPLVFGAVYKYEGQVAVFNVAAANGVRVHYRHIFPTPPGPGEAPDCATAGVLGTIPGIVGMMQATEVIKLITGIGQPLCNHLLTFNALTNDSFIIDLSAAAGAETSIPKNEREYAAMNYEAFCGNPAVAESIGAARFATLITDDSIDIIDVREFGEQPAVTFRHLQIPLSGFRAGIDELKSPQVVLFCQSGIRSAKAATIVSEYFNHSKKIYTLSGGLSGLNIQTIV